MNPSSEKKVIVTAALAALKRRFLNRAISSIGIGNPPLPGDEGNKQDGRQREAGDAAGRPPTRARRLDDRVDQERPSPWSTARGPGGRPEAPWDPGRSVLRRPTNATRQNGQRDEREEDALPARSARAASRRRSARRRSRHPCVAPQSPIARARSRRSVNTLVSSDSVAGKISAAPSPITARAAISSPGLFPSPPAKLEAAEDDQPGDQHALAADPVAEVAGGEHEGGEHQVVGIDDPLELRVRRVAAPAPASAAPR